MTQNQNDKHLQSYYKELSIQVRLSGLSFCVYDPVLELYEQTDTFRWNAQNDESVIENSIRAYLSSQQVLQQKFSKVRVMHTNEWFSLVPKTFFSEENAIEYLKYSVRIFSTDIPSYDDVNALNLAVVYLPFTRVNDLLLDYFPDFDYEHCASVFLKTVFSHQGQHQQKAMYVSLEQELFLVALFDSDKLLYYNQFEFYSEEDFLYYLLFSARELSVDLTSVPTYVMGETHRNKALIQRLSDYVDRVIHFEPLRFSQKSPQSYFLLTQMF